MIEENLRRVCISSWWVRAGFPEAGGRELQTRTPEQGDLTRIQEINGQTGQDWVWGGGRYLGWLGGPGAAICCDGDYGGQTGLC